MSENKDGRGGTPVKEHRGYHSRQEILSQPHCWTKCLEEIDKPTLLEKTWKAFAKSTELLFVGCGSSYYAALSAATAWNIITGQRTRAVPASEVLFFPDLTSNAKQMAAVVISRSGRTSEAVQATEALEAHNIRTLAVSCASDQPLERAATGTLLLQPANEESTVMTRSFTSMLLGLEYLAGFVAGDHALTKNLWRLPGFADAILRNAEPAVRDFVQDRNFADYICLGQGPFYGLACESALKVTEMSVSYGQSFHTLEFRHGPKSVVSPETLVIFLISEAAYEAECSVLEEIKSLGGTTLSVTNHADARCRATSDLLIELNIEIPEIARIAPYVFAGQLLGLHTGVKKGLDPDHPRHLDRVVMFEEADSREESRKAPR